MKNEKMTNDGERNFIGSISLELMHRANLLLEASSLLESIENAEIKACAVELRKIAQGLFPLGQKIGDIYEEMNGWGKR